MTLRSSAPPSHFSLLFLLSSFSFLYFLLVVVSGAKSAKWNALESNHAVVIEAGLFDKLPNAFFRAPGRDHLDNIWVVEFLTPSMVNSVSELHEYLPKAAFDWASLLFLTPGMLFSNIDHRR